MKISVIVPIYNCEPYVERCIRSIMAQTYTNLEIICVNDGSTDNSGKILEELACEDARIRAVHQDNAGASAARNAGLDMATGELITFVDSDDAIEPDMYETLLPYFEDESVDIVHCGYKRVRIDGSVKDVNGSGKVVRQNKYEAAECLAVGRLFVGSLWNKVFRAKLFQSIRMNTQLVINEDVMILAELFNLAGDTVYVDIGKYLFYERKSSVTSVTKQKKKLLDCLVVAERIMDIYLNTPTRQATEGRVLNTQIGLYRWYVMNECMTSRQTRKVLAEKIDSVLKKRKDISFRQRLNYALMRNVPAFYKLAYSLYDRIRIPNWDV